MRSFVVTVDTADAELAADRLWQQGVRAVEERAAAGGRVELWTAVGDDDASIAVAVDALDPSWEHRVEESPDEHPMRWRDHARPMGIGERLVVVPAWLGPEARCGDGDRIEILIETGAAFGLGDHPTTALTLAVLERELGEGAAVLDVGCGTGVLSIAAAMLGAGSVRAIDRSSAAVEVTRDNARRNGVGTVVEVDTTPVGDLAGPYDIVVANILAPTLISMAGELRRLTAPGGRLVISGVLADRHGHVVDALSPMRAVATDRADGWAAVTLADPEASRAAPAPGRRSAATAPRRPR